MRLIDADVLISELKESALHHCNNPREDCLLQRDRVIVRAQPTVEAIPKADYEARHKADMAAMITELQLEIEELKSYESADGQDLVMLADIGTLFQQKINNLKED